jgi:hypothetical protein
MRTHLVIAGIVGLAATNPAAAATITLAANGDPPWIHVLGEFKYGDGERFKTIVGSRTSAIVLLESPGGSLEAGLSIGRTIREKHLTTMAWRTCASSCATAWLGGVLRLMFTDSRIGFHAVYNSDDGSESGAGNALFGAYLNELGLSDDATFYLSKAAPRSMTWLTLADARRYGIDAELVAPDAALVLPTEPPRLATAPNVMPAPQSPPPPAPPTIRTLPACESTAVTNILTRIGNSRGVAVFSVNPFTVSGTPDMQVCAAYASTSAGRLAVSYTVTWTDRRAGTYWVQLLSYRRAW